jgi:hypothetical protein
MAAFTAAEIHRGDWLPLTPGLEFVLFMSGVNIMVPADPDSIMRPPPISIVARKNSAAAPFERITWNEFRQCELHRVDNGIYPSDNDMTPMTATGPGGLKLFSIHVALGVDRALPPGVDRAAGSTNHHNEVENKCQQWLLELMREFPDRHPDPLPRLAKTAQSRFPGLSERGFHRALLFARKSPVGNSKWGKAGRPKSPHEK